MCSLLLILFMALLFLVPRAIMKCQRHRKTSRKDCHTHCHTHRRHSSSRKHKLHRHDHHHHRPHEYSIEIKKDLGAKYDKPFNYNKAKRTKHECKCQCQCNTPPLTKRDRCCDRYSISSVPISQCSLISLSSTT